MAGVNYLTLQSTSHNNQPDGTMLPQVYRSIHKLPFSIFLDAACDGELTGLAIAGNPTEEELAGAWESLQLDYQEAIGGAEKEYLMDLYREVHDIDAKLLLVGALVSILKDRYVARFAGYLRELISSDLKFDVTDPESYDRDLKRCSGFTAHKTLLLQEALQQIKGEIGRQEGGSTERPSRAYYAKVLINLSDHAGYGIRAQDITVFEFCERVRRLTNYVQQSKSKRPWGPSEGY